MDQPVQSASQLPAAIKDESHSTVGPNIVKDKVMAHSMSSDISQNTGIESSIFDFSKWKLERIGENFCLITDTEKIQLPNCFWGKSNPKVLKRENKTLIISPNGHALEVRKGENEKLIFIETKIPLSDTDKNKGLNRLNESTENDTDKLEKHVFAENDGRHSGTAEQNSEMNTKVCHEMQSNKENQGARSDPSHDPARSDSTQLSASRISTTLDAKTHVKEKTFSVVDENVFGNKKSTDGAISTMQEQDRNIEPDKIFKKSTDTGSSDKIKNKGTDQRYNATTDSLCTPLNKTDDSVSKDAEDNYTVSLKNDYQQSVSNPESDRKLPTSESRLEGQITDGTKAKLLIKRDEIETDITELMQKIKIEGNDSKNIASGNGNPLKDGRQQSHEDLWSTRKINGTLKISLLRILC